MGRALALLLLAAVPGLAQFSSTASHIRTGTSLPATCSAKTGDVFFLANGTTGVFYTCTAANAWTISTSTSGGSSGSSTTPGYVANALVSGGGVVWTSGYTFSVSPATYFIQNIQYSSPLSSITLASPDATNDRIDTIAVDTTGTVVVLQGTAATSPIQPAVDPATQLALTFIYVTHASSQPASVTTTLLYDENAGSPGEWVTSTSGSGWTVASTNNPYHLTKDVEATSVSTGYLQLQIGSGTVSAGSYANLIFYVRSKASWGSKRSITLGLFSSGTQVGQGVTFGDNQFGFSSAVTTNYQQIVVPMNLFAATGFSFNQIRFTIAGSGTALGFYLDYVQLQTSAAVTQSTTSSPIPCVGTPGNTVGNYGQSCYTTLGLTYTCSNTKGCSVTADWVTFAQFLSGTTDPGVPAVPTVRQSVEGLSPIAFSLAVVAGDTIVAIGGCNGTNTPPSGFSDSQGNTYTRQDSVQGWWSASSFVATAVSSGTLTLTEGTCASGTPMVAASEISGSSGLVDVHGGANTTAPSLTTTLSGDLIIYGMAVQQGGSISVSGNTVLDASGLNAAIGHQNAASAGTYASNFTVPGNSANMFSVALKAVPVTSPGNNNDIYLNTTTDVLWKKSSGTWGSLGKVIAAGTGFSGWSANVASTSWTGTLYAPLVGGGPTSATEAATQFSAPYAGTFSNLRITVSSAFGAGQTVAFTVRKNGAGQTVTCSISGASATTCSDTTHSFTFAAGDTLGLQAIVTGTVAVSPNIMVSYQIQ